MTNRNDQRYAADCAGNCRAHLASLAGALDATAKALNEARSAIRFFSEMCVEARAENEILTDENDRLRGLLRGLPLAGEEGRPA